MSQPFYRHLEYEAALITCSRLSEKKRLIGLSMRDLSELLEIQTRLTHYKIAISEKGNVQHLQKLRR